MAASGMRTLLTWCRQETENYSEVNVYDMASSWRDGLAFCAIIHRYRPDLIEFDRLSKENIAENNELAFSTAEKYLDIPPVIDAMHMVENIVPDKLSVITYVSQLYHCFKNKTPANQGYSTKMKPLPLRGRADSGGSGSKVGKRTSPSALSGTAKRMATALRNVFRSDAKEEHASKNRDHSGSMKQNRRLDDSSGDSFIKSLSAADSTCSACHGKVYLMERLVANKKLFHRSCFKCRKCGAPLRAGTYQYFSDADIFCCLFDCTVVSEQTPQKPLVIRLRPIRDVAADLEDETDGPLQGGAGPESPKSPRGDGSKPGSSAKQFAVVKRNTIKLNSLPQSVEKLRSRGAVRRGAHSSKSNSSKSSERKRSHSLGSKYKGGKKGHEPRRKYSPGSARNPSPRGSCNGREERSSKKELASGKDSLGRHKNDIDSAVLGTALKMALMEEVKRSARSRNDSGKVESEEASVKVQTSDDEGQRSERKDFPNEAEKPPAERPAMPKQSSPTTKNFRKVVVKELRMETLKEELTPRSSRSFSRELSSDDLSLDDCGSSFKDELLKRADTEGNEERPDSETTAEAVDSEGEKRSKNEDEESTEASLSEKNDEESEKPDAPSDSTSDKGDVKPHKWSEDCSSNSSENEKVEKPAKDDKDSERQVTKSANSRGRRNISSVRNLRDKFMNIDEMIDAKHKNNLAKYSMQRRKELQSVTAWTQQTSSVQTPNRKQLANSFEVPKRELGGARGRGIKQLTAMYMGEIEKNKKKGTVKKLPVDLQRGRTPSDASSGGTERSESAAGSMESWSRRTSLSSCKDEEKSGEESSKRPETPKSSDDTEKDVAESTPERAVKNGREKKSEGDVKAVQVVPEKELSVQSAGGTSAEVSEGTAVREKSVSIEKERDLSESRGVSAPVASESEGKKSDGNDEKNNGKNEACADEVSRVGGTNLAVAAESGLGERPKSPVVVSIDSRLPEVKIQSPQMDPSAANSAQANDNPGANAKRTETAPVTGKELTLEILFPGGGSSPTLKRNAASHDSGIDMPATLAPPPSNQESCNQGEEVNVVLPIQNRRETVVRGKDVLSDNDNSTAATTERLSDADVSKYPSYSHTGRPDSLAEDSSSSSTPRMSIIIAQERASTKINSRYFSLETSDPKLVSEYRITEERCPDEVMDVEGEFRFGQERIQVTRAGKGALVSIYKNTSQNGGRNYVKEDEISLDAGKIADEIQALGMERSDLEAKGVEIEKALRESIESESGSEIDEDLLRDWLHLVQRRNMIMRQEAELTYLIQSHTYEQRYRAVEDELRHLVAMRDDLKSTDDVKRERDLLSELLELVHKRNFIIDHLEEDRLREKNAKRLQRSTSDDSWDHSPEYTKVAFSRFYC